MRCWLALSVLLLMAMPAVVFGRSDDPAVFTDPAQDAVIRRTDSGGTRPLLPAATLPDLLSLTLRGWVPASPSNIFGGSAHAQGGSHVLRIDIVFAGLLNPPGSIDPFDYSPTQYGPSPVYGFFEFDVDRDRDTGGEMTGPAVFRYLANAARFGGLPTGSIGQRTARHGNDIDFNFFSPPYYERSGADFTLALCGCTSFTIESRTDMSDLIFGPGETWTLCGRFFQRAGGYQNASIVTGGSTVGMYDPMVRLQFSHSLATDRTTISLVFPLDPQGAAMVTGQPVQPIDTVIDTPTGGIPNHSSIQEALEDVIQGALGNNGGPLSGPTFVLTDRWRNEQAIDQLNYTQWRASAIVGTTYAFSGDAIYVWTDVGFEQVRGDMNSDGQANLLDRDAVSACIAQYDGGWSDADGVVNGSVRIPDFAYSFSHCDINGDGLIDAADVAFFGTFCAGDWDRSGSTTPVDIAAFIQAWVADVIANTTVTDLSENGSAGPEDIAAFVQAWLSCL
ncbi:MAG: hypothetical protein KF745_11050 [Phycisphaeraceae bacterium]|nr:hypothetical protein [Phycisphaeraceae bacterium]